MVGSLQQRLVALVGCCSSFAVLAQAPLRMIADPAASVVKVIAVGASGGEMMGSAVIVGPGRVATNCHVVRDARSIVIESDGQRLPATFYFGDGEKDLCLLSAPQLARPAARVRSSFDTDIGQQVSAIGFPGGGERVETRGRIESVYDFQDARVLRVSAPFDQGASGGGLFTAEGELIGILTFRAPQGGAFHFVIPIDWVRAIEEGMRSVASPETQAFWEREPEGRAYFLRAAWFSSTQDWPSLVAVCKRWAEVEPGNEAVSRYARLAETRVRGYELPATLPSLKRPRSK